MPDLENVRLGDSEIILKDNEVKSSLLPQTARELNRTVRIQDHVVLDGALYASSVEVEGGDVHCKGAVYAKDELHIANDISNAVVFDKAVASSGTIAAFLTSEQVIFGSDLNAKSVRLKNCYVGGSIFANEITLEDCVVLGGVFGNREISMSNCLVGTFHSPSVQMSGINDLLYPAAFSVEPIETLPDTKLYNLAIADLGALYKGETEKEYTGRIEMDFENDRQKMVLSSDQDAAVTTINSYSVSSRVLAADAIDFDKMENHFLIESGALGTQILKVYNLTKEDGSRYEKPLTVENIASFMFDVLKGRITPKTVKAQVKIADLEKQMM